jgi:hypothetical protein
MIVFNSCFREHNSIVFIVFVGTVCWWISTNVLLSFIVHLLHIFKIKTECILEPGCNMVLLEHGIVRIVLLPLVYCSLASEMLGLDLLPLFFCDLLEVGLSFLLASETLGLSLFY